MALALPELPEDIQRRIVVSLPPKAFARSSFLSKSWLSFYNSTRCSFDFKYDKDRVPEELTQEIVNFDKSFSASLLREKLTVEEFNINMSVSRYYFDISQHYSDDELADPVCKWLATLFTTNNIVKVLRIRIRATGKFYMPPEIFFNESLQVLHLERNCILDRVHPRNLGCLRVLSLYDVFIDRESTDRLLTACPILEQLTWRNNVGRHDWMNDVARHHIIIKGLHKLKVLDIEGIVDVKIVEAPALENVCLEAYNNDGTIINAQACRRIKVLKMFVNSKRTAAYIYRMIACLPALQNLNLIIRCDTDIRIYSRCLKNLTLLIWEHQYLKMVMINAPNLRCYEYRSWLPTFSRQLMMKTEMLEMVVIDLMSIEIDEPRGVLEVRKALRMIEQLKLGVDTLERVHPRQVRIKASRLDEKLNVSATRVIERLDAGDVVFDF